MTGVEQGLFAQSVRSRLFEFLHLASPKLNSLVFFANSDNELTKSRSIQASRFRNRDNRIADFKLPISRRVFVNGSDCQLRSFAAALIGGSKAKILGSKRLELGSFKF
jgi:hypothetical protein